METFEQSRWYQYMEEAMRDLARQTYELLNREELKVAGGEKEQHDYAFVVFPLAKAYEGFLKKVFLDMKLINRRQYYGEFFRIGRALNPSLPKRLRSGWVYGRLVERSGGDTNMPNAMWEAWKKARNRIFHYFPDHHEFINLAEARVLVEELAGAMETAVTISRQKNSGQSLQ